MSEVARRRLLGALVLIGALLLLAELLPEPALLEPVELDVVTGEPAVPTQRVIYDLRAPLVPPPKTGTATDVTPAPAPPPKPRLVLPQNPAAGWYVQLGTYASKKNAESVLARMQALGQPGQVQLVPPPVVTAKPEPDKKTPPPKPLYRVRIGPYADIELARPAQTLAIENGFAGAQKIEVR